MKKAHSLGILERVILGLIAVTLGMALLPATMRAEVTRVEISSKQDVLGGKPFGTAGAYEKLVGKVYFAVDPNNLHNRIIADLDKAPKNAQGKVEFSADLFILRPKDPSRSNGALLFDIPNRGGKAVLSSFNRAKGSVDPTTEEEFGDGLLMREGFIVVSVGWEFDIPKNQGLVLLTAPVATNNGKPITGWLTTEPWFIPNKKADSYNYASGYFTPTYPPLDPKNPEYRLTERPAIVSSPRLVSREDWQFGRVEKGQLVADLSWVTMKGGFKPGMVYQLAYESSNPPVAGVGFAAVRDLASALKYNSDAIVHGNYVYTYGASQVGRWQRQLIYEGFTIDEQGRKAVDALFIQTGGTGLGSFNERWAQADELGSYTQTKFPIRYETITDPVTGKRDGLGARIPAGLEPKIMEVDTESEYYDRGRVTSLRHVSMDGSADLPDPPNVRIFLLAGARHSSGSWPPTQDDSQQLPVDPLEYRFAQRALFVALDSWVKKGVAPPPSLHPRVENYTAVSQNEIKFPNVPYVQWPSHVPGGFRNDLVAGPTSVLPFLVPQVDKDGNVISGLRLPEQSVPLGTYGGWAFRSESYGQSDTLVSMAGSYIPFAKTKAEREKVGDPRLSLEERYPSRSDYLKRVENAANKLAADRYLLPEDVQPVVNAAGQRWDWTMNNTVNKASR
jgi:alpha/beta hydrolase family protein